MKTEDIKADLAGAFGQGRCVSARSERLARYAKGCPSGETSHVTLRECGICGWLSWISSDASKGAPSYVVDIAGPYGCERCSEVLRRSPEIFNWVVSAISRMAENAAEPRESAPAK